MECKSNFVLSGMRTLHFGSSAGEGLLPFSNSLTSQELNCPVRCQGKKRLAILGYSYNWIGTELIPLEFCSLTFRLWGYERTPTRKLVYHRLAYETINFYEWDNESQAKCFNTVFFNQPMLIKDGKIRLYASSLNIAGTWNLNFAFEIYVADAYILDNMGDLGDSVKFNARRARKLVGERRIGPNYSSGIVRD